MFVFSFMFHPSSHLQTCPNTRLAVVLQHAVHCSFSQSHGHLYSMCQEGKKMPIIFTFPVTGDLQRWTIAGRHTSTDYYLTTCNTVNRTVVHLLLPNCSSSSLRLLAHLISFVNAFLLMKVAWFLEGKWIAVIDLFLVEKHGLMSMLTDLTCLLAKAILEFAKGAWGMIITQ